MGCIFIGPVWQLAPGLCIQECLNYPFGASFPQIPCQVITPYGVGARTTCTDVGGGSLPNPYPSCGADGAAGAGMYQQTGSNMGGIHPAPLCKQVT